MGTEYRIKVVVSERTNKNDGAMAFGTGTVCKNYWLPAYQVKAYPGKMWLG